MPLRRVRRAAAGRLLRAAAAVCAAAALAPAAASATSLVYVEDGDVVVSSLDGSAKTALTTDGEGDQRYVTPQRADDGTIVAARMSAGVGVVSLVHWGADGSRLAVNLLPRPGLLLPVLPIGMSFDRSGRHVAYGWSYTDSDNQARWGVRVVPPDVYSAIPQGGDAAMESVGAATFWGRRLVVSDRVRIMVQRDEELAPYTFHWEEWLAPSGGIRFTRAVAAPDGKAFALELTDADGQRRIAFGSGTPGVPGAVMHCFLEQSGPAADLSWSPDGQSIAWHDGGGVKVAGAPDLSRDGETCALRAPVRLISATGSSPSLGGGTTDLPALTPRQPGPGPDGEPNPGPQQPAPRDRRRATSPRRCVVPRVKRGAGAAAARRALARARCRVRVVRVRSRVPRGRVVSIAPRAGTRLAAGRAVRLTLSRGRR